MDYSNEALHIGPKMLNLVRKYTPPCDDREMSGCGLQINQE